MFQFSPTKPVLIGMKLKTFSLTKNNTFALVMNKVVWMLAKEILVDHSVSFRFTSGYIFFGFEKITHMLLSH